MTYPIDPDERFDLTEPECDEDEHRRCERLGCGSLDTTFNKDAGMHLCGPCDRVWNE